MANNIVPPFRVDEYCMGGAPYIEDSNTAIVVDVDDVFVPNAKAFARELCRIMNETANANALCRAANGEEAKMHETLKSVKSYLDGHTVNILELRGKVDAALAALGEKGGDGGTDDKTQRRKSK